MNNQIVPIVEGHGELSAVPILVRRILNDFGVHHVGVARPFRVKRNQVVKTGQLERAARLAASDRNGAAALLVILDADDDCPARLGPALLARCQAVTSLPTAVVIANKEFEAWYLGAKESLRGVRRIHADANTPDDPEAIRDAKGALAQNMDGRRYLEVDDQPAFAAALDLNAAQSRCGSFDKLVRDVLGLAARIA